MGDTVRFDDNVHVECYVYDMHGWDCVEKVGEFRLNTRLERDDYTDEYTGNERSEWAMSQQAHMWPLGVNPDEFNFAYEHFGDQWECWANSSTELTQNWDRSELDDLGIIEYDPSYSDETTTSIDTTISASIPKGVSVSADIDTPKVEIQSELDGHKLRSTYDFWGSISAYDAAFADVQQGTVTAFDSLKPADRDKIAPTYMYGGFEGWIWECEPLDSCNTHHDRRVEDGSLFNFFYEQNIDDL